MVVVRPFKGLRPKDELAEKVASPPYDVLDSDEAREMVGENRLCFLRVVKPEVDLDPKVDLYSDQVYEQGAKNLQEFIGNGTMVQDPDEAFYFYRQIMGTHEQYGLVATVSAQDYLNENIKKHEFTRPDKEADRVRHITTMRAQCGPVFLTYKDIPHMNELQDGYCTVFKPNVDFKAPDGIRHTLWAIRDPEIIGRIIELFSDVPHIYVADGHHRSAAGTIVAQKFKEKNPDHTGEEEYNFFLAVLFPQSHMKILEYNRAVTDLNGLSLKEYLEKVSQKFDIFENADPSPSELHRFSMYVDKKWYGLVPKDGTFPDTHPVKRLDAAILQDNLLSPVLAIDDPRASNRIKFVGGIRGTKELERLVDSDMFAVAFSLFPVTVAQLMDVADSGNVMPPKSTWFEPKLRSGLVVHLI
ncbi:MAG TPA: DUF1015 domain-containing protein [Euryarchaeota archaeon]|nr:DUF1015 domain-containing protein [Euryarchaeota archaeon]